MRCEPLGSASPEIEEFVHIALCLGMGARESLL